MAQTFRDDQGRIMVGEPAGGTGGGVTSMATRPATPEEITAFHDREMQEARAALDAAEQHRKDHDEQDVVVGASPPPGPLDRSGVVAQGVGRPGNPDPRLGQPLGGHTEQQGQPQQPVDKGTVPPAVPKPNMAPAAPPPASSLNTLGGSQMTPRGPTGSI